MDFFNQMNASRAPTPEELLLQQIREKLAQQEADRVPAFVPTNIAQPRAVPPGLEYQNNAKQTENRIENYMMPVPAPSRAELRGDIAAARGLPVDIRSPGAKPEDEKSFNRDIESFKRQLLGVAQIDDALKQAIASPVAGPDPMVPLMSGLQWLASPHGTAPNLSATYAAIGADAEKKKELKDKLVEKLRELKLKAESGLAKSDIDYMKMWMPQTPGVVTKTGNDSTSQIGTPKPKDSSRYRYDQDKIDADTKQLGKDLDFGGITGVFKKLNDIINIDKWNGEDIPGSGITKFIPQSALTDKGQQVRQNVLRLMNKELYEQSGAQINDQEMRRLMAAMGTDPLSDDRALIKGLKNFRDTLHEIMLQKQSKYRPAVVDEYSKRDGSMTAAKWAEMSGLKQGSKVNGSPPTKRKNDAEKAKMTTEELRKYLEELSGGKK